MTELADYGLRLCVSDLVPVNFMKDRDGRIVAVDFGGYSFLPPSFFAFSLKYGGSSSFALHIASMLDYPPSSHVGAMVRASCALAPYNSNNVGEQISLLSFGFLASRPLTRTTSSLYCRKPTKYHLH